MTTSTATLLTALPTPAPSAVKEQNNPEQIRDLPDLHPVRLLMIDRTHVLLDTVSKGEYESLSELVQENEFLPWDKSEGTYFRGTFFGTTVANSILTLCRSFNQRF